MITGRIFAVSLISALIFAFQGVWLGVLASGLDSVFFKFSAASSPSEVIQLVNQLRKANGLPPYVVNNALMAAAQAHSEYQASLGSITHTGAGGSRPRDRAIAMGYGGGASVFVSENIAGGSNLTAQNAVQWWQGDAPHLDTMLSPNYRDVGAGVAVSGGVVYYTLDAGYVANSPAPAPSDGTTSPGYNPTGTPVPTTEIIIPVAVATPKPDGSIVHVVQQGQTLWRIADTYKVKLDIILALNGLTQDSVIFPGEKLLIKTADVTPTSEAITPVEAIEGGVPATETITATEFSKVIPTASKSATGVADATQVAMALAGDEAPANEISSIARNGELPMVAESRGGMDSILVVIAVFVVLGTALVLVGSLLRRGV